MGIIEIFHFKPLILTLSMLKPRSIKQDKKKQVSQAFVY